MSDAAKVEGEHTTSAKVEAPFSPPDILWIKYKDAIPEGAIVCGYADNEPVYAGRVYFHNELQIGSVDLKKKLCTFCSDNNVHESSDFEIMTVPVGEPLDWVKVQPDSNLNRRQLPNAGITKEENILYVGRITEDEKSFIGSVHFAKKMFYVAVNGSQKVYDNYEILIHKHLEFLCICPPCPRQCRQPSGIN